ncbi:unnamed protein product [marine sediment metagenome]|uniref:DUF6998 domain-containing protein n=1 Tax=marine sediment metagenome TaxID=412755 RepID=X1JXM2_9ZZZZ
MPTKCHHATLAQPSSLGTASLAYKLTLNEKLTKHHDAVCDEGRNAQIKTTFGTSLTFPVHHVPDYYLGIRMNRDGTFEEIYNGPGALIQQQLAGRKPTRTRVAWWVDGDVAAYQCDGR